MPESKYGNIITEAERKELLFAVVNQMNSYFYGASCTWTTLSLIQSIGQGHYFENSKNTYIAKWFAANDPELDSKLQVFYHQNKPDTGVSDD